MTQPYKSRPQVRFLEFNNLKAKRIQLSNEIWAILVGSKLASNAMSLTTGSTSTLSEIYPAVRHIKRFNLRPSDAQTLLRNSEQTLCTMGLAQVMAFHEDFLKTCLSWLVPLGKVSESEAKNARAFDVHELLSVASKRNVRSATLKLFHLLRIMRNCHIHSAGVANKHLEDFMVSMTKLERREWADLTRTNFVPYREGQIVVLGVPELIATLAVSKRLAYEANLCLQRAIPPQQWAHRAAQEYFNTPGSKSPLDPAALKTFRRFAALNFGPIRFTETQLTSAIRRQSNSFKKKRTLNP